MTNIPVGVGELVDVGYLNEVSRAHWRKDTPNPVHSTASPIDLLNGEITIQGGAMGVDRLLRLTAWGNFLQNAGGPQDVPAFRLRLGGTTLLDTNNTGVNVAAASGTRTNWRIVCEIKNSASNVQWVSLDGRINTTLLGSPGPISVVNFTTGSVYTLNNGYGLTDYRGAANAAIDTSVNCVLQLDVLNAISHANYETNLIGAVVEVV